MKGGVIFAEAFCPTLNIFNLWSFILFQKILQHFKNISDHGFSAQILYVLVILFLLTIIVLIMITSIQHGYFEFFKNTVFMGVVFNVNSREVMRVVKRPREMDWSNFVFLLFLFFFSAFILLHLLGYFFWYKKNLNFQQLPSSLLSYFLLVLPLPFFSSSSSFLIAIVWERKMSHYRVFQFPETDILCHFFVLSQPFIQPTFIHPTIHQSIQLTIHLPLVYSIVCFHCCDKFL